MSRENSYRKTVAAFILAVFVLPPIAITIGSAVADVVDNWLNLKVLHDIVMFLFIWLILLLSYVLLLYVYRKAGAERRLDTCKRRRPTNSLRWEVLRRDMELLKKLKTSVIKERKLCHIIADNEFMDEFNALDLV